MVDYGQKCYELLSDGWKQANDWWFIPGSQGWPRTLDEAYNYLCSQREIDANRREEAMSKDEEG